jgi:hypothetical protein
MVAFTIRFIKSVNSTVDDKKENDDVIRITKDGENFIWNFKDAHISSSMVVTYTCWSKVVSALYTLLKSAAIDTEPAACIQVFAPGFPSFLLTPNSLSTKAIETVVDCFTAMSHNWPEYECVSDDDSIVLDDDTSIYETPVRPTSRPMALPRRSLRTKL